MPLSADETQHPQRGLPLDTAENVRDLGGYTTADGATTRFGRFVRSGDMDRLSRADQQALLDYGITTVIDLRMAHEVAAQPNVFASSEEVRFLIHDFWGDRFDDYRSADKTAPPEKKLADLYCAGLRKSGFVMAEILSTFAEHDEQGYVFHCRSGKDRTGLVAALLLAIAGVPEPMIYADFELTAKYLRSEAVNPVDAGKPGAWQRGCDAQTMAATFAFLRDAYGGVPGYLREIGVTQPQVARIRDKLLAP